MTDIVKRVITVALLVAVGVLIMSIMFGVATDLGASSGSVSFEYVDDGDEFDLSTNAQNVEVTATNEHALAFGGEGYVDATTGDGWYGGNWSVFATAWLDGGANEQARYTVLAYDNETVVLEFADGGWHAYHFVGDESAHASINADTPGEMTSLAVVWDNTTDELTLTDGVQSDTGVLTSETPVRSVANDWFGTIDEVRFLTEARNDLVSTYTDDPVHPLEGDAHTARYLFDEGTGDTTRAWYAGDTDVDIVDGDWVEGVAGPDLVDGDDYTVDGSQFTILDGYLDDAPVAHVTYHSNLATALTSFLELFDVIIMLVGVMLIILTVGLVVRTLGQVQ